MILILLTELSQGVKISCPIFNGPFESCLKEFNKRLLINPTKKKVQLYNGVTGLPFDRKTSIGVVYILKLNHLVNDKIHTRSTGSYPIVTQQPLKVKNNLGRQKVR